MNISADASKFDPGSLWHPQIEADFAAPTADTPAAGEGFDLPSQFRPFEGLGGSGGDALSLLGAGVTVTVDVGAAGKDAAKPEEENIGPGPRAEPASRDLLSGVNYREHAGAEVDTHSGDVRLEHGQEVNLRSAEGDVSVSRETTFVATHGDTAPTADVPANDKAGIEPAFNLVSTEGSADVSVASASASGEHGSVEVSALGAEAQGEAAAGFGPGTVRAEASGSAGVYLAKAEAEVHAGPASASGEVAVGAEVEGAAEVEFDPLQGDVGASVEAGGFAGARAEGEAALDVGPAEASAQGDVGVGVGAEFQAEVGIEDGTITLDVGAHAYLGVGGGGELSLEIDVPELAGAVGDFGQSAIDVGGDVIGNVGEFGGSAVAGVAEAWNSIAPW